MGIINGKAYDWSDISLKMSGLNDIAVQEINYDDELEKELVYGKGSSPRGYGTGNYKASGKISLLKDDFDDIITYCRQNNIPLYKLRIPKIVVNYANNLGRVKTDVLNNVSFAKTSGKAAQGDKSIKVDLDLIIAGTIQRDGVDPI